MAVTSELAKGSGSRGITGGDNATQGPCKGQSGWQSQSKTGPPAPAGCQDEETGGAGRFDAMGARAGGPPLRHPSYGLASRSVIGCHGGRLLWGEDPSSRRSDEVGGGSGRHYSAVEAERNEERGHLARGHRQSTEALPLPRVPSRVSPTGSGGFPDPRGPGQTAGSGKGRRLDGKPRSGRSRSRCSRRDGGTTQEVPASGPRSRPPRRESSGRSRPRGGSQGSRGGQARGKVQEEKEEGQKGEGLYKWTSPGGGGAEGSEGRLFGNRVGSQGEAKETGPLRSPQICLEQESQKQQSVLRFQHKLFIEHARGLQGPGDGVQRGDKGQGHCRTIPGSPDDGGSDIDAAVIADDVGGRPGGSGGPTYSNSLLPEHLGMPDNRSSKSGAPEPIGGAGLPIERQNSVCRRHSISKTQGTRVSGPGHELGHSPKTGSSSYGVGWPGGYHRAEPGAARRLQRGQDAVEDSDVFGCQGRVQGQRKRSEERYVAKGREAGGEGRQERKGQGEKVNYPPEQKAYDRRGEAMEGITPEGCAGVGSDRGGDRAALNRPGLLLPTGAVHPLAVGPGSSLSFSLSPPKDISGGVQADVMSAPFASFFPDGIDHHLAAETVAAAEERKKKETSDLTGLKIHELGEVVHQELLGVVSLRSSSMGERKPKDLFPLPTSKSFLGDLCPQLTDSSVGWLVAVCVSLNSMWGGDLHYEGPISENVRECLQLLSHDVKRLQRLEGELEDFSWGEFFNTRSIDYKGDEVKTARTFSWQNICPALPAEIGRVPLEEVCSLGAQHYVLHFDSYIKERESWVLAKAPRVMVSDEDWPDVCRGLVSTGVCTLLPESEVFDTGHGPLLNGLFGVSKEEWVGTTEVFRLIMNLVPLNQLAHPLRGDVETLPAWSLMNPYFLQPTESLIVSSEDIRCFFYTMSVPTAWHKYLAFNKVVPPSCLPPELQGQVVYLASRVLPMGFVNSVSLAQHVHRNLTLWSGAKDPGGRGENPPEAEIRKDRPLTNHNPSWRVYLDNYDLLEKVEGLGIGSKEGTLAPSILALRSEYEIWEIPRNLKKSVSRQLRAEVQGAQVDGAEGVAYPRESKLLKYLGAALSLVRQATVTQKQLQVVCGGLVYFSMFCRPLLGCLNSVWGLIESFNMPGPHRRLFPAHAKAEIMKLVSLIPLARLNFRLPFHEQVTCSDASTTGGGICASAGCSRWGALVSEGILRGDLPELRQEHRVLSIGLFDGISALRVALDLLGLQVAGHVSVEVDPNAARVVESHFPEIRHISRVEEVNDDMVREWARVYSQVSVVLVGGGPPCQGVSGLNADRKGALRDERSRLFVHVPRITALARKYFPWCQVHSLMESVASMDVSDRQAMSEVFGSQPWKCDAGTVSWCSRPRLYWLTWELQEGQGVSLHPASQPPEVVLQAYQDLELVCQEGWIKTDSSRPFPTFTTSRPRTSPGRKPAGLGQCTQEDVLRWEQDQYRYPPYQYASRNLLVGRGNSLRLPTIEEKEFMMGFPVGYTINCVDKARRGTIQHQDVRHSLIGNSWSIPVIACLLTQLFSRLGLCPHYTPQELVDMLTPMGQLFMQARLWRRPLRPCRGDSSSTGTGLVQKLANMISIKGEDILLTTPSSQLTKYHRLRASVPSRLWRWRVVSGWQWTGSKEHINSLELRSVLTTLKWRLQHRGHIGYRFIHLVDSLVVLHCLSRGRSSSKKLRSSLSKINALLLCSSSQALWGYVHTDQNPADKPSRWGRRVRTRFRNA